MIKPTKISSLLLISLSFTLPADVLTVGPGHRYDSACAAIEAAVPRDVVLLTTPQATIDNDCTWVNPGVTIRSSVNTEVTVLGAARLWSISADDTRLESLRIVGGIGFNGRNLALKNVRISKATTGLHVESFEDSTISVENCEITDTETAVNIERATRLIISGSRLANAAYALLESGADNVHLSHNELLATSTGLKNVVLRNFINATIENNVFEKSYLAGVSTLLHIIDEEPRTRQLSVQFNTFINKLSGGSPFIELLGRAETGGVLRRNKFEGTGTLNTEQWATNEANTFSDLSLQPSVVSSAAVNATIKSLALPITSFFGVGYLFDNVVTLSAPAPANGVAVTLTSSHPSLANPFSSTLTIPQGQTKGSFIIKTSAVTTSTAITISARSSNTVTAKLQAGPVTLNSLALETASMGGGLTTYANSVALSGNAPSNYSISLRSSHASVKVPSSVTVVQGTSSTSFQVQASVVSAPVSATITATHTTGTKSASVSVLPVSISRVVFPTTNVAGGSNALCQIFLTGPAPAGGQVINLTSSDRSLLPIQATVVVPAGKKDVGFGTATAFVSSNRTLTLTASMSGSSKGATLTVIPLALSTLYGPSTAKEGSTYTVIVKLNGRAPSNGFKVTLTSSKSAVVPVPTSVTIPANFTSANFSFKAGNVSASTPVTITGTANGTTRTANVTVTP